MVHQIFRRGGCCDIDSISRIGSVRDEQQQYIRIISKEDAMLKPNVQYPCSKTLIDHVSNVTGNNKIPLILTCYPFNSLLAHIDEFRVFLNESDIDIISINETKLDSSIKDNEVYIPDYEILRKDRKINGRHGGGICIYIRCNLNYKICKDLSSDELEYL